MHDLDRAKELLHTGAYTCVLCKGSAVYTSTLRGVAPMLAYLTNEIDLNGFSAADKVVGKAAAMLFVLAGVKEVYAGVMSRPAAEVLQKYGIKAACGTMAGAIINRTGTGLCPMEQAVKAIEDPQEAFVAIRQKREELKNK